MVYYLAVTLVQRSRRLVLLLVGMAVVMATVSSHGNETAGAETAKAQVADFHATLLQAVTLPQHSAREAVLQPSINAVFDLRRIAAISLGRTWRGLGESQQQTFVDLLTTLVVATYADRFDRDSGQQFVTDRVEAVQSGFVVYTRLLRDAAEDVSLNYFLRNDLVFNVVADGVSDLSLRRADYNSMIKNQGYEVLLEHIRKKIEQARAGE